jgi:hypothetical protein
VFVQIADNLRRERASQESLLDAVQELAAALEGPGPHLVVQVQVGLDELRGKHAHPLGQREVRVVVRAKQREVDERLLAGVLDVAAHVTRRVTDVAGLRYRP